MSWLEPLFISNLWSRTWVVVWLARTPSRVSAINRWITIKFPRIYCTPQNSIVCSFCGKVDDSVKECRHKRKYDKWQLATEGLKQGKQVKDIQNKKSVGSKEVSKCRLANDIMQGSPYKKQKQGKGIKLHRSSSRKCSKCNYGHPGQLCPRDTGGCFYCGKMGHFVRVCRKKEADLKKWTAKESQ